MKMSLCWLSLILLSCCSFSSFSSPCNVSTDVTVPCPNVTAAEVTFALFRDRDIIAKVKCVREKKNAMLKCERLPMGAGVDLQEDKERDSVSFLVTESRCGLYQCEGTVIFPPPMITVPAVLRIQVLEGTHCGSGKDGGDASKRFVWIWIAAVAFLGIYSATVTTIAVVTWVKLRNVDSHSDYINTKPRAARERRKKRGVQKPIPRHF